MNKSRGKPIPHNLPPRDQLFVDREREIEQISQALLDPHIPIVTIAGLAGIGKTTLALEVAHRLLDQERFAGGICWVYCPASDNALDAILHTIQATFGLAPAPTLREGVRHYLRTSPCLLILDGYEVVSQDMEVLAFLERLPEPSKALLTSRQDIYLGHSWSLRLAGLPLESAVHLFVETAGRRGAKVSPEQTPLVAEICQFLEGYPLAILIAAPLIVSMPLDTLRSALRDGKTLSLEEAFKVSYDGLDAKARVLLRRLAVLTANVDEKAIENVCRVEGWQVVWSELLRSGFVREQGGRYSLHPVMQSFASKLLEEAGERDEYEERAAAHFLALAQSGASALTTGRTSVGVAIVQSERANMLAGQEWYWAHARWDEVIAYGHALDRLFDVVGLREDRLAVLRRAAEASQKKGDIGEQANLLHNLAMVYQGQDDLEMATRLYQESLTLAEELGDLEGESVTLHQLGTLAQTMGTYDEARRYYERALAISERLGDAHALAITCGNLGAIFEEQGDFQQALGYLEKSAEVLQRIGDVSNLAIAYRAIARTRQKLGDFEASVAALSQALTLSLRVAPRPVLETAREAVGYGKSLIAQDKYSDALALTAKLGVVLGGTEREVGAMHESSAFSEGAETSRLLKEPTSTYQAAVSDDPQIIEAVAVLKDALSVIASVASVRIDGSPPDRYNQALETLALARQVDEATGSALELAAWVREASGYEFVELEEADRWPPRLTYLVHLAVRYERDEDWPAAMDAYRQARVLLDPDKGEEELRRYTELGFRLGLYLRQDGHWSEALEQQAENVAGYRELGNLYGKASAYMEMGHIYQMMNVYDLALLYYGEAYYLYQQAVEQTPDEAARQLARRGMADAKESVGSLEFQVKVLPKALADLEEAEKLYITLGMPGKAAIVHQTLERAQVLAGGTCGG
jgi:tetratricopeptide (TPR) repeat protein